jgi:hypothetical protein
VDSRRDNRNITNLNSRRETLNSRNASNSRNVNISPDVTSSDAYSINDTRNVMDATKPHEFLRKFARKLVRT